MKGGKQETIIENGTKENMAPTVGMRTQSSIERRYSPFLFNDETLVPSPINLDTTIVEAPTDIFRRGMHAPPPGCIERSNEFLWEKQEDCNPSNISFEQLSQQRHILPRALISSDDLYFNEATPDYGNYVKGYVGKEKRMPSTVQHRSSIRLGTCASIYMHHSFAPVQLSEYGHNISGILDSQYIRQRYVLCKSRISSMIVTSSLFIFAVIVLFIKGEGMTKSSEVGGADNRMMIIQKKVNTFFSDASLDANESPQHSALQWITNDDPMQLDPVDGKLIIRYSLAVFFFSLSNSDWDHTDTWMSGSDVCYWYGITCNTDVSLGLISEDNHTTQITSFNISDANLSGPLVREIFVALKVSTNPKHNLLYFNHLYLTDCLNVRGRMI